jgi:hypothetical protein
MSDESFDDDVYKVMEMVLGDYLFVYLEGLEDQMLNGDITPEEQLNRSISFSSGCKKICEAFGLKADVLDVDKLLAADYLCDYFAKEDVDAGRKDSC